MDYLANNWLVIISLMIALLGGVPGILSAIVHFRNIPRFHFSVAGIITGELPKDDSENGDAMILLPCTVSNNGPQPLSPETFELSIDIDGRWKPFSRGLIPEGAQFVSTTQEIQLSEPWKHDLQTFSGPISKGQPVHGFLMFLSTDIPIEKVRQSINQNCRVKITCVDIYNKSYYVKLRLGANQIKFPITYPKHGVSIRNRSG